MDQLRHDLYHKDIFAAAYRTYMGTPTRYDSYILSVSIDDYIPLDPSLGRQFQVFDYHRSLLRRYHVWCRAHLFGYDDKKMNKFISEYEREFDAYYRPDWLDLDM